MQLSSSEPCVVILTEKEVEVSVNNHATFTLPKNYLAAFACNNNVIELSTLNSSWMKDELDIIHFGVFYALVLPMIAGIFVISRYALY